MMTRFDEPIWNTRKQGYPSRERTWERPFTAKRYLHPPCAENIATMWPDFKVMLGDVEEGTKKHISGAFRLLVGEAADEIPFEKTGYLVREDGAPIHGIVYNFDDYRLHMESFCSVERVPTAYTCVTVSNGNCFAVSGCVSVMAKTGFEDVLTGMGIDGYCHFDPGVGNWGYLRTRYEYENGILRDDTYELRIKAPGFSGQWQGDAPGLLWRQRGLLKLKFSLAPGESRSFTIGFKKGEVTPFDYEEERDKTLGFWKQELQNIHTFVGEGHMMKALQYNLTAQLLQMFAHPVGKDYLIARQGGLQRATWPVEALEFLIALDQTGNFSHYTQRAYETMINEFQVKDGEDRGRVLNKTGIPWASDTAGAVWGIARHVLLRKDNEVFMRFRDVLLSAFDWMQRQRAKTADSDQLVPGIFPPMASSDWEGEYQSWCWTDGNNLMAYEWLGKALKQFGDPRGEEVISAHEAYRACLIQILESEMAKNIVGDEIRISNRAGADAQDPQLGAVGDSAMNLLRAGVIEPGSQCAKLLENYYRNRGYGQHGLMGLMSDGLVEQGLHSDSWAGHTWYTSATDNLWFYNWLQAGETEKALQTLKAQLLYSMSPEFYMCERYADNDPYFVPWMPNASANGRTLMMLLDAKDLLK